MNYDIIITCAVTGSGDAAGKHPQLPKTPEEILGLKICDPAKAG